MRGLYGMGLSGGGGKPRLYPWRNASIPLPNRRDVNKGWPGLCLSLCGTIVAVGNAPIGRVRADWWLLPSSDHTRSRLGHRDDRTDVPSPTIKGRVPFMVRRPDNGKRSARGSSWDPYGHNGVNGPAPCPSTLVSPTILLDLIVCELAHVAVQSQDTGRMVRDH